jgi:hypothetical protein
MNRRVAASRGVKALGNWCRLPFIERPALLSTMAL